MVEIDSEKIENIEKELINNQNFKDCLTELLALKEDDYIKFAEYINKKGFRSNPIEANVFAVETFVHLPIKKRFLPFVSIFALADAVIKYEITIKDLLLFLKQKLDLEQTAIDGVISLFGRLQDAVEKLALAKKEDDFKYRNSRFLSGVALASDLRANYDKEPLFFESSGSFDPILDLFSLTPLARIRLYFGNSEMSHIDFMTDLNMLNYLINQLEYSRKQLQGLGKVANIITKEVQNGRNSNE